MYYKYKAEYNPTYRVVVRRALRIVQILVSVWKFQDKNRANPRDRCKITSCHQNSDSSRRCPDNNNNNCCSNPTSFFSIEAARDNTENRLHTNNTGFSFFSYLIIGTTSSKGNGGYEFQFSNDKYNQLVTTTTTPTRHWLFLLESKETIEKTDYIQITHVFLCFLIWL